MSKAVTLNWPMVGGVPATTIIINPPVIPGVTPLTIPGLQASRTAMSSAFTGVPAGNTVTLTNNSSIPLAYTY